jgi:hypothetical protein
MSGDTGAVRAENYAVRLRLDVFPGVTGHCAHCAVGESNVGEQHVMQIVRRGFLGKVQKQSVDLGI